jgi:phenylalanine-4-hydroxylase
MTPGLGLTTGHAPEVEAALFTPSADGSRHTLIQPYKLYTRANHAAWSALYRRMQPLWKQYAMPCFVRGLRELGLDENHIPRLEQVNRRLSPLTGFRAIAVGGYVPAYVFFDHLRRREFPTTITIRPADNLDYLPEPDIFHDIAGHVPMHTDPAFAEALVRFGECARTAARRAAAESPDAAQDDAQKIDRLQSNIRAMARVFWFTVEFGLMRARDGHLCACGSGLLSSHAELQYSIESPEVTRLPFDLARVVNQPFDIDHFQPLLFVLDSFEQLYEAIGTLEHWLLAGDLDHVATGEPSVSEADLRSFLSAQVC